MNNRNIVTTKLAQYFNEPSLTNVERSIYNYTLKLCNDFNIEKSWNNYMFKHIYITRAIGIFQNLKNNVNLSTYITENKLGKDVGFFNSRDFKISTEEQTKPDLEPVIDGLFKCPKCKGNKTTYYSVQLRSADEPMTNFITCLDCKNRWKN